VCVHADHLVVEGARGDWIEQDPGAFALDHLVVDRLLVGLLDLQLHLSVGLDTADADWPDFLECVDSVFGDLQHRATVYAVRILIAEDETIIRLDLRELLERAGHEVVAEARDGEEAVALASEHEPELVVLDVRMPRLDGIEAAKRILAERPIPIVMLTAYGQEELVSRAVEAGVFGYLVKPFREQDLMPAIATARARHEELAAVRDEAESLADALAARKAIERAKGLLMEKEGLSEGDAFARLRKASQVSGRPLRVIAEAVIDTLDPS
jgi:AmiR/NasT family two-component response regulator